MLIDAWQSGNERRNVRRNSTSWAPWFLSKAGVYPGEGFRGCAPPWIDFVPLLYNSQDIRHKVQIFFGWVFPGRGPYNASCTPPWIKTSPLKGESDVSESVPVWCAVACFSRVVVVCWLKPEPGNIPPEMRTRTGSMWWGIYQLLSHNSPKIQETLLHALWHSAYLPRILKLSDNRPNSNKCVFCFFFISDHASLFKV